MRKRKPKTCSICEAEKERIHFPKSENGRGVNEYCYDCEEKYQQHALIMNKANVVIDAVEKPMADKLILAGVIEHRQHKYRVDNEMLYLSHFKGKLDSLIFDTDKILAIGKYNEKRRAVSREVAQQLVEEGAAVWENSGQIRHLFSGKELQKFVTKRDKSICYFCKGEGDRITFLTSRSIGGLLSPNNSVCCCRNCKEVYGENFYFYQWLNIPILSKEEAKHLPDIYTIIEKKNQTSFLITEEVAKQLVEEEMATFTDTHTISVLYDRNEFRDFIMNRDSYTCYLCGKYGDTLDHVVPQAIGGMTTPKNCLCACSKCNEKKGHKDPEPYLEIAKEQEC